MIAIAILSALFWIAIPIAIIVVIVKLVTRRGDGKTHRRLQFRDFMLWTLIVAAGYSGAIGIGSLPFALQGTGDDVSSQAMLVTYLLAGMLLLISGLLIKEVTGKFLMILGVIFLIAGIAPAFDAVGSAGAFVAVLVVFVLLIVLAVRASKKEAK